MQAQLSLQEYQIGQTAFKNSFNSFHLGNYDITKHLMTVIAKKFVFGTNCCYLK